MKKIFKRTSLLLISALMSMAAAQAQKSPQDMDRFIDALMKKMTVEEKIGQLNLPVTGDIGDIDVYLNGIINQRSYKNRS